jgi:hypothetical protein
MPTKKWLLPALALALIGSAAPRPSDAQTIYFAGSEDTDFTMYGTGSTFSAACGTTYSSECWSSFTLSTVEAANTTAADPPANRFETPTFTATSSLWIHGWAWPLSVNTTTSGEQALLVRSPNGVSRIVLRQTGTAGQLKISTRNAAGTITDLATATGTFNASYLTQLDLYINYTCSSAGSIILYFNGAPVINYSGNPCTDSATSLDQVGFATINNNASSQATLWSQIIIASSDTRSMALKTLCPQAAGNTQSWTPSTVADVCKTVINDSTSIATSSANALSEWTVPTTLPSGAWNVLAVVQSARVEAATSGPQHFEWLLRAGGSDNVTGTLAPSTAAFTNFSNQIWTTNPTTGSPWSTSDITGGGLNLGIESLN